MQGKNYKYNFYKNYFFEEEEYVSGVCPSKATFTLSVFGTDNCIFFTVVSLEMSRSHSSLQLCLEYCLYERATRVKPEFLTSNHSDSE